MGIVAYTEMPFNDGGVLSLQCVDWLVIVLAFRDAWFCNLLYGLSLVCLLAFDFGLVCSVFHEIPLFTSKATLRLWRACKQFAVPQDEAKKRRSSVRAYDIGVCGTLFYLISGFAFQGQKG